MHDSDRDTQELQRLLGPAVADYRALRHSGVLQTGSAPRQSIRSSRPFRVAASILVAAALLAVFALDRDETPQSRPGGQIAISTSLPARPIARATALDAARPSVRLSRLSFRTTLPRSPSRQGG